MPRRRPIKDAATELEQMAIEARELLAQLASEGLEVKVDFLGIHEAIAFRVKLPTVVQTANQESGEG